MGEFRMPSLGADMEAGTLVEWLKHPGDQVHRGDVIAVVETQKGAIEIEVFEDGEVEKLLVETGTTVPVGTTLAVISGAAEGREAVVPIAAAEPGPALAPAVAPLRSAFAPAPRPGKAMASPAARRLAAEHGVALDGLTGSGPAGAIISTDVLAVQQQGPAVTGARRAGRKGLNLAEMRAAIAAAMARSKREIPHYYLTHTIDIAIAERWLADANASRPPTERLLLGALFLKASTNALAKFEEFNGFYQDGRFEPARSVHAGLAVALRGGGLIAPAIHDAQRLSLDELMDGMRDLVQRARTGMLRSSELSDPTVTISSLGERGVEGLYAVIYPPQVAIVGFGTPVQRPVAADSSIAVHTIVTVTLAADHRVSDGHRGALLLREIDRQLQDPEAL